MALSGDIVEPWRSLLIERGKAMALSGVGAAWRITARKVARNNPGNW
jgi:hypothetical protein